MSYDVHYYSFSPTRADTRWLYFQIDLKENQELTFGASDDMEGLKNGELYNLACFIRNAEGAYDEILFSLQRLDIAYGGVTTLGRDNFYEVESIEPYIVEAIERALSYPRDEEGAITKQFIVKLFTSLTPQLIREMIANLMKKTNWGQEESHTAVMRYLTGVKPVAKDLKETNDSVFISDPCGELYPKDARQLLADRSVRHYNKYIKPLLGS